MKKALLVLVTLAASLPTQAATKPEIARWEQGARQVTLIRDDWSIAHVYGKNDPDDLEGVLRQPRGPGFSLDVRRPHQHESGALQCATAQ